MQIIEYFPLSYDGRAFFYAVLYFLNTILTPVQFYPNPYLPTSFSFEEEAEACLLLCLLGKFK